MCLCGEGSAVRNLTYLCVCRLARSLPLYRGKIYGSGGRDPIWCWFDCAITSHYVGWHWAASQAKLEWWVLAVWVKAIIYLCYRCKSHGMDRVHPKLLQLVANNTKRISQGGGGNLTTNQPSPAHPSPGAWCGNVGTLAQSHYHKLVRGRVHMSTWFSVPWALLPSSR